LKRNDKVYVEFKQFSREERVKKGRYLEERRREFLSELSGGNG